MGAGVIAAPARSSRPRSHLAAEGRYRWRLRHHSAELTPTQLISPLAPAGSAAASRIETVKGFDQSIDFVFAEGSPIDSGQDSVLDGRFRQTDSPEGLLNFV